METVFVESMDVLSMVGRTRGVGVSGGRASGGRIGEGAEVSRHQRCRCAGSIAAAVGVMEVGPAPLQLRARIGRLRGELDIITIVDRLIATRDGFGVICNGLRHFSVLVFGAVSNHIPDCLR